MEVRRWRPLPVLGVVVVSALWVVVAAGPVRAEHVGVTVSGDGEAQAGSDYVVDIEVSPTDVIEGSVLLSVIGFSERLIPVSFTGPVSASGKGRRPARPST